MFETPGAANVTLETLAKLAAAFKVGLIVDFVPFSEMLRWENRYSQDTFDVTRIDQDIDFIGPEPQVADASNPLRLATYGSQPRNVSAMKTIFKFRNSSSSEIAGVPPNAKNLTAFLQAHWGEIEALKSLPGFEITLPTKNKIIQLRSSIGAAPKSAFVESPKAVGAGGQYGKYPAHA
jgi:hypothetical protein